VQLLFQSGSAVSPRPCHCCVLGVLSVIHCLSLPETLKASPMNLFLAFLVVVSIADGAAFEFPKLSSIFKPPPVAARPRDSELSREKAELLRAISFTNNGKTATPSQQANVLSIVDSIERKSPSLSLNDTNTLERIDGVWYLQYTSPSIVGDDDQFPNAWKPKFAREGDSNIETKKFNAKGSVSAAGIVVDTSNRVVQQIFNVEKSSVSNNIELDFGTARVSGPFRKSPNIPNRAIVSFQEADIVFKNGFTLSFGFLFTLIALARGSKDNGWLETTFLSDDIRIGRGNKGTMFVLTRDPTAVKP